MTVTKNALSTVSICATFLMTGCGGGGDGGDGGGDGDVGGSDLSSIDAPALEATVENGEKAAATILYLAESDDNYLSLLSASPEKGFDPITFTFLLNQKIKSINSEPYSLNSTFNEKIECYYGGTRTYTGTSTESSYEETGVYDNCNELGVVMNGTLKFTATGQIDVRDTETYRAYTDFTIEGSGVIVTIHEGSFYNYKYTTFDKVNRIYSGTFSTSLWIDDGTENYRYDDLNVTFDQDYDNYAYMRCYKAGRIYINNLAGYLDIDSNYDPSCSNPFIMSYYQLQSGSMEFTGSGSSRAHVEANTTTGGYTVTVVE